jgi:hypothetical protein
VSSQEERSRPDAAPAIQSVEQFRRVLALGLGRPITFLQSHDAAPYRDVILEACIHWTGYDQQVEGSRNTYLFEVLQATGQPETFAEPILAALARSSAKRDISQLLGLVLRFADDEYPDAREALYRAFDRDDTADPFSGASELISLDGLDGLLYVADRMGAAPPDDEVDLHAWYFVAEAEEEYGKDAVQRALAAAQTENPRIQAFLEAVARSEAERGAPPQADRPDLTGLSYGQVKQAIAALQPGKRDILSLLAFERWGRDASDADLAHASADLLVTNEARQLARYLRLFARRPYPRDPAPILPLVRHADHQVMVSAFRALARIAHPSVRALAIDILADNSLHGFRRGLAADLLVESYQPGDEHLLSHLLATLQDDDERHIIGMAVRHLVKKQLSTDVAPALLALYEYGPCSFCRDGAVETLHKTGQIPAWMREECRHDASLDLRDTVRGWDQANDVNSEQYEDSQ